MASSRGLRPGTGPPALHLSGRRAKHEMRALPCRCAKHHRRFTQLNTSDSVHRNTYSSSNTSSNTTTTTINTPSNTVSNHNNEKNRPINTTFTRTAPTNNTTTSSSNTSTNNNSSSNSAAHLVIANETSHWPDIRPVVTAGFIQDGRAAKLQIPCSICLDDILEFPTGCTHNPERRALDAVVVLPCGHFFGRRCLGKWFSEKLGTHQAPSCPNCRFRLAHKCGHVMQLPSAFTKWTMKTSNSNSSTTNNTNTSNTHTRASDGSNTSASSAAASGQTMLSLPVRFEKLLSEGGQVGDKCAHCRAREIRSITAKVMRRWDDDAAGYRDGARSPLYMGLEHQHMRVFKQYLVNRRLVGVW
ncbi:hypothetical protein F5B20DRAFT_567270 [Whalleya microplaca]|nr:hypothetical protein F5B20DRAFT_567270 [Whalleya microplaca]